MFCKFASLNFELESVVVMSYSEVATCAVAAGPPGPRGEFVLCKGAETNSPQLPGVSFKIGWFSSLIRAHSHRPSKWSWNTAEDPLHVRVR